MNTKCLVDRCGAPKPRLRGEELLRYLPQVRHDKEAFDDVCDYSRKTRHVRDENYPGRMAEMAQKSNIPCMHETMRFCQKPKIMKVSKCTGPIVDDEISLSDSLRKDIDQYNTTDKSNMSSLLASFIYNVSNTNGAIDVTVRKRELEKLGKSCRNPCCP
ncbi:hypothetical protein SNEBB_010667 [Seison nebaliae]|nr:hypothetical protein SNEBB_010667 [Seison nebaliae]